MTSAVGAVQPDRPARIGVGVVAALGVIVSAGDVLRSTGGDAGPANTALLALGVIAVAWALDLSGFPWPRLAFVLAIVFAAVRLHFPEPSSYLPILLLPLVGWIGFTGTRRDGLVAVGLSLAHLVPYLAEPEVVLPWGLATLFTWLITRGLAKQKQLVSQLEAAQAGLQRQAADAERRRIAGEIHDVVAHSLAVMVLHLTAARMILLSVGGDPRALAAVTEAEQQGRQSMEDIRRAAGVLHTGREAPDGLPLPTAAELPALVAQYRAGGLPIRFEAHGDLATIPPTTGLALYRIAQEALANVVKHAPGAQVQISLCIGREARLRVRNGPSPGGSPSARGLDETGQGLPGMRERTHLHGGTFTAGRDGIDWVVECRLPLPAAGPEAIDPAVHRPSA